MSRIRGMNTSPERLIRRVAYSRGLRYRIHVMSLPGRPDMVFMAARVAVFIDGDFWHGWRFPAWRGRLPTFWQGKIARNRKRDQSNFRKLWRANWLTVRIWEHEARASPDACVDRIVKAVRKQRRLKNRRPASKIAID